MGIFEVVVDDAAIDEQLNICSDLADKGKNPYPGMSYADGVRNTLDWLAGHTDEPPFDPEDLVTEQSI